MLWFTTVLATDERSARMAHGKGLLTTLQFLVLIEPHLFLIDLHSGEGSWQCSNYNLKRDKGLATFIYTGFSSGLNLCRDEEKRTNKNSVPLHSRTQ